MNRIENEEQTRSELTPQPQADCRLSSPQSNSYRRGNHVRDPSNDRLRALPSDGKIGNFLLFSKKVVTNRIQSKIMTIEMQVKHTEIGQSESLSHFLRRSRRFLNFKLVLLIGFASKPDGIL